MNQTSNIGTNATMLWRTLCFETRPLTFDELRHRTSLDTLELAFAIGWLVKANRIITISQNGLDYYAASRLLSHLNESNINSRDGELYAKFMEQLQLHFRNHRNVAFYASQLCISPKYLSFIIKRVCGKTPHQLIETLLIEEISFRLRHTNSLMKEIAWELNFPNLSFFAKFFKRKTGHSPVAYRKLQG